MLMLTRGKKRRALLTAACGLLAVTGCSSNGGGELNAVEEQRQIPNITMMAILYGSSPPEELVEKLLEEKTNTELDFTWVPGNVYTDRLNAAIVTGTLPKIVQVMATDLKSTSVVNAIRSGVFWEIAPYLRDYPNLMKYLKPDLLQNGAYFGKVYGLYWELEVSRQGIQYRKDWLDKLGLQEPRTIDELYQVMTAFAKNDPDGNGKQDTYGLVDRNDLIYGAFKNLSSYFGTPNGWGVSDGKLIPEFMTKEYLDTMKFMRRLYVEGLINPDFSVTSKSQQEEMFYQGQGGIMIGNLFAPTTRDRLKKFNPKAEVEVLNRIRGPKGDRIWASTGLGGLYLFPKSSVKSETELRELLTFFDRLLTEEVYNLVTYGVEDRHYKRAGQRAVELHEETRALRESELNPYMNVLRPINFRYWEWKQTDALQAKVDRLILDNQSIAVYDPTAGLISPTQAEKGTELQKIVTDATYRYILGLIDEEGFRKEVEKWRKLGGDRMTEELTVEYGKSVLKM